jgi:hypothetical protein
VECASPRAEHTSSANAITWHFNDDFNIVVHSVGCQPCKDYSLHFCSSMIEQDVSLCHTWEVLHAHFMVNSREPTGSTTRDSRRARERELKRELELCRRENDNLRRQVRHYHDKVDDMRRREYDERHDRYERHDSYDCRKRRHTSTEVTPSSSGGYAWPHAETPQIVVSPPQSPTLPRDATSPPQTQSPAAPIKVDPNWPPLLPPGEFNQSNATMPWLPMIPRHLTLDERDTAYPMIPKGFHHSRVDNTIHAGAVAKAAQRNEALGMVPLSGTRPSAWCRHVILCGHPTMDFPRRSRIGKAFLGLPAGRTTTRPFTWLRPSSLRHRTRLRCKGRSPSTRR